MYYEYIPWFMPGLEHCQIFLSLEGLSIVAQSSPQFAGGELQPQFF
jgi:hypothetical protein